MTANQDAAPRQETAFSKVVELLGVSKDNSFWETMAITAFVMGALTIVSFSAPFDASYWRRVGMMFAIALGAWMGGGALGFLFGVPRYKSAPDSQAVASMAGTTQQAIAFIPNTNLEQISDWLTKIIVGATLVQLEPIGSSFVRFCLWTATVIKQRTLPDARSASCCRE